MYFVLTLHVYINMVYASFSYSVKIYTRRTVFDFNFSHGILIMILMDHTHGPSVSKQIIRNTLLIVLKKLNLNLNSH